LDEDEEDLDPFPFPFPFPFPPIWIPPPILNPPFPFPFASPSLSSLYFASPSTFISPLF